MGQGDLRKIGVQGGTAIVAFDSVAAAVIEGCIFSPITSSKVKVHPHIDCQTKRYVVHLSTRGHLLK